MPLETASTIAELNSSYPLGASDTPASVDDHLRLIKTVLKADALVNADIGVNVSAQSHNHTGTYAPVGAVTSSGLTQSTAKLLGRTTSGNGAIEEINVTGDAVLAGGSLVVSGVPTGAIAYFAMSTAPSGWIKANGAAVSRSTYAVLFSAIGVTFGAGDGSTTFNLPDLRGEFMRGVDDGRGVDSGRAFGSWQADEIKSHTHYVGDTNQYTLGGTGRGAGSTSTMSSSSSGGSETRPRNIALLACIKY